MRYDKMEEMKPTARPHTRQREKQTLACAVAQSIQSVGNGGDPNPPEWVHLCGVVFVQSM